MERPEVQMVYWEHGRFNLDLLHKLQGKIYPTFFQAGDLNMQGIETAGTTLDSQRNAAFNEAQKNPQATMVGTPIPLNMPLGAVSTEIVKRITIMFTNASLMDRQGFLIAKWNRENPEKAVTPYPESYPTEEMRDRIAKITDETSSFSLDIPEGKKLYWREIIPYLKERFEGGKDTLKERDENWLRMLAGIPEIARNIHARKNGTRTRILVTIGEHHRGLSTMIAANLSDQLILRDDIFLTDPHRIGESHIHDKLKQGQKISDEEYLRTYYYIRRFSGLLFVPDQSGSYSIDQKKLLELWHEAQTTDLQKICTELGLSISPEDADNVAPIIQLYPAIRVPIPKSPAKTKLSPLLIDQNNHPNTVFISKQYLTHTLSSLLNLEGDEKNPLFNLIKQIVENITAEKVKGINLGTLRKEIFARVEEQQEEAPMLEALCREIAKQNPHKPKLWKDKSEEQIIGKMLIEKMRICMGM